MIQKVNLKENVNAIDGLFLYKRVGTLNNHMGGIIVKYFPDCYRYGEDELNRILSIALQTKECQQIIAKIKSESRETTPPQKTVRYMSF